MKQTIAIIGNGNMAFALALGLAPTTSLEIVGRNIDRLNHFEAKLGKKLTKTLYKNFDAQEKIIILCVKPINIKDMSKLITTKAKTVYSVLAGVNLKTIQENINATNYVRVMPNLAANINKSMTTLTGDIACKNEAIDIFNSIGYTLWVNSQKELDIATALAGSGPAYLALVAEALSDGAVKQGLKRDDALILMRGLFSGFSEIIQNVHPAILKDAVMSPGGTTAAGYGALEENGVRSGFIKAIEAAYKQAESGI